MADIASMCDSDEEVFFGSITAREIELMWRDKQHEKNERKTGKPNTELRVSCEQLVPSIDQVDTDKPIKENHTNLIASDSQISLSDQGENCKNLVSSIIEENKTNSFSVHETLNFIEDDAKMDVDLEHGKIDSAPLSAKIDGDVHFQRDDNSSIQVLENESSVKSHSFSYSNIDEPEHEELEKQLVEYDSSVPNSQNLLNESKINRSLEPKDFFGETPFEKSLLSIRKENGFEVFIPITPNEKEKFYCETTVDNSVHSEMCCSNTVISEVTDINDKNQMFSTINDNSHFNSKSAAETKQIVDSNVSLEFKDIDNCNLEVPKETELNAMIDPSSMHYNNLECSGAQMTEISLNPSESGNHYEYSIEEDSSGRVSCTKTEIFSSEKLALKSQDDKPSDEVHDIELKIDGLALGKLNTEKKEITKMEGYENKCDSDSDGNDKSFVSLPPTEEINCENKEADCSYVPPDKKQCFQTNKENEEPKSRIPVSGGRIPVLTANRSKSSVLKPPTLKAENVCKNTAWVPGFKKKKIPPPKKPDYIVSPNKLGNILKNTNVSKLNRPKSAEVFTMKTPLAPQHSIVHQRAVSRSESKPKPQSALKSKLLTPNKINEQGSTKVNSPLKNPMYEKIVSPVAEYIKNRTTIIRNVTPSGNLPNFTPKKLQETISTPKKASPKGSLPPMYYSSAEKRLVLEAPETKASNLPKLGQRQAAVYNSSPKYRVLKHIRKIRLEETDGDKLVKVAERQVRRTSLSETSFSHLPPAAGMEFEVSVLEEQ